MGGEKREEGVGKNVNLTLSSFKHISMRTCRFEINFWNINSTIWYLNIYQNPNLFGIRFVLTIHDNTGTLI